MNITKNIVMMKSVRWFISRGNPLHQLGPFIFLVITFGCVEPYYPTVANENKSPLVVEGFLNSSEHKVSVKLSRAIALNSEDTFPAEENAKVILETESGSSYQLSAEEKGQYELGGLAIDNSKKYRVHIFTTNGKEYTSDYIQPKPSPTFDSLIWEPSPKGITFAVYSHDPNNNTHYYQWSFEETWSYHSIFYSYFKFINGVVIPRTSKENIYYCWNTKPSNKIIVASTTQLNEDRVSDFPVHFIPKGDKRIEQVYSIIVRQKTLDEKTYNYLKQLENNTENLGGLFDPLPFQAEGNIHNVNESGESVLGYFNASTIQEKRITFSFYDFPFYLLSPRPETYCEESFISFEDLHKYNDDTPIISLKGNPPRGYSTAAIGCVDCRIQGGTTIKPDFMP